MNDKTVNPEGANDAVSEQTTKQTPASNAEPIKPQLNINLAEVLDISAGILNNAFIKAPKDNAKLLFKEIKGGKHYPMGNLTFGKQLTVEYKLAFDYSEFVGAGFNFDIFQAALFNLLHRIHEKMSAKEKVDFLTGENSVVINLPGVVQSNHKEGEQYNVMFMALDFPSPEQFILRLMFVDPEQFRRSDDEAGNA
mgnify:FL=1